MTLTAAVTTACDDLLIGGAISGSTLSGGTSIAAAGISVVDYGALWGTPGFRQQGGEVIGQPGLVLPSRLIPTARRLNLALAVRPLTAAGVYSAAQYNANMDVLQEAITDPDGFLLQWVRDDSTTVWIRAYCLSPAGVAQLGFRRNVVLPLVCPWPYWQDETLNSDVIAGGGPASGVTLSPDIGGTVQRIYNPTLLFASDGYFEDDDSGLRVTVSGSASAVTVARSATSGRWTVVQSGSSAPGLATWNDNRVMMLTRGGTFSATVSTTVSWRDQYG